MQGGISASVALRLAGSYALALALSEKEVQAGRKIEMWEKGESQKMEFYSIITI